MHLTTAHSLWLAPLCLLLGGLLAWWLYRKQAGKEGFAPRVNLLLAVLRAVAVSAIAFFLLEPMLRMLVREVRKPVVAVLHDGSASLRFAGDTAALRASYANALRGLHGRLDGDYQVRAFTYGGELKEGLSFDQAASATDLAFALREVNDRLGGPDLAAVVVDGDGIVNRGRDPRLDAERLGVPIHAIALGDTTVRPDLLVKAVEHNRICFLGNEFPVRARIAARHLKGQRARVQLKHAGRVIAAQEIVIDSEPFLREVAFSAKAEKVGTQRYTVEAVALDMEQGTANNAQDFFIEVLDARQNVLLLAAAPHPDLGALRSALSGMEGYAVELAYAGSFTGAPEAYDLLVLHQLPGGKADVAPLLARAKAKAVPTLFVLGQGSSFEAYNAQLAGVRVNGARQAITDAQAVVESAFPFYSVDAEAARAIERFPPLQVPFAQYELGRSASALARQRVGTVGTEAPLIAVAQQDGLRSATICGEGIWRWRMADHQMHGSFERFDGFFRKLVQFLAIKADKKRFRVEGPAVAAADEAVAFTAELYDATYEPVLDAEPAITLKDDEGREYPFAFVPAANGYRVSTGVLPAGHYAWSAQVAHKGERFTAQGELHVRALIAEQLSTVADHALLADLAARSGGSMNGPDGLLRIAEAIESSGGVARSYVQPRFTDLIEARWIFFAILLMLSAEWALRRRSGAY